MRLGLLIMGAALAATSGCAGERFVGRPGLQVVTDGTLPPPTRQDNASQQREYVVGPLDKVDITVFGVPELTRSLQVDANGHISFPLIGDVDASGKTPNQLAEAIGDGLRRRYIKNPQVTVNPTLINQVVSVDGEVKDPGQYPVTGRLTLMRTIATAKGVTEYADTNYVVVFRQVDDKQMAALYDLRAIRQGIYADPEIYANDVVLVGASGARRIFQTVIQGSGLIVTPLIALLN